MKMFSYKRFGFFSGASLFLGSILFTIGCGGGDKPASTPVAEKPAAAAPEPAAAPKAEVKTKLLGSSTITGKVVFKGTTPKRPRISLSADKVCKMAHEDPVREEIVIVNENGTLRNVLVYVQDGLGDAEFDAPSTPVTVNQQGCVYKPHVFGMMSGQSLIALNSDATLHNIHSLPKINKGFNFGQPNKGDKRTVTFEEEEIVKFKCDVHGWMNAYVGVFSHPYFAVTGDDGSFEIKGLPAGKFTLAAWHELYGNPQAKKPTEELSLEVEIAAKESKTIKFTFEVK